MLLCMSLVISCSVLRTSILVDGMFPLYQIAYIDPDLLSIRYFFWQLHIVTLTLGKTHASRFHSLSPLAQPSRHTNDSSISLMSLVYKSVCEPFHGVLCCHLKAISND